MAGSWKRTMAAGAAAAIAFTVALQARADDVKEGVWINLFDGESVFGWTNHGDANWNVKEKVLTADEGTGGWLAGNSQFGNFELSAKIKLTGNGTSGLVVRAPMEGSPYENGAAVVPLGGTGEKMENDDKVHDISVRAIGKDITASIDGKAVEGVKGTHDTGYIGILYHKYHGIRKPIEIQVSEVKLRPLGLKPLFNGTSLDGWNIIPGHKSEFSVKEGAINIVHGNGQIETASLHKDFILQLDIFSNGDHLNSGVFFRSPAGVFWKGYESQVRNQWVGDDRTKPVDFGTGGIYGVQESRKVVSSDREWFNMTINCEANHYAVWLNGYQVSDLFDTRPINKEDDAKEGLVDKPGTINLQGHDPTTDLSFKNINVQDYPAAK